MISGHINMNSEIEKNGKEVVDLQIKALRKLKNSLDDSFEQAVKVINKCKSKVVVCGVGKSGIIAKKISATLSSVGTPSFSLNANDSSHGDLGKLSHNDVLILISNSGNTEELKNIIKFAKNYKIKLIGIVSNKNSNLYKFSNIKLYVPEVEEAGYGIVPTSSTTAQLCLGDALAITLMKKKKFSKLDFKKFHPSGNLGIKLKTASDLMLTKDRIPFVNENEYMWKALKILNNKKLGFLVVTNKQGALKGFFSDGDLKRILQKKINIKNFRIKKFMTKNPYCVEKNTLASEVLKQMNQKKITGICVYEKINKKKIIGVIHVHGLIAQLKMSK